MSDNSEVIVCTPERLKTIVATAVKDALDTKSQLVVDRQTLARRLDCSAAHIDNLRKKGLPTVKVGELIRFDPEAVLSWLRAQPEATTEEQHRG